MMSSIFCVFTYIHVFSLVKYLLESFVHFSIKWFLFLSLGSSLYSLDTSPFSCMCLIDISPSQSSPTHLAGADFDGILFITFHFVDNISHIVSKNSAMA